MAAKVNKKLAAVLLLVAVIGAVIVWRACQRPKPQKLVERGDLAMADRNYREAARWYVRAMSESPKDPALLVKYGDALREFVSFDASYVGKERAAWEKAAAIDPNDLTARQRLLTWYAEEAQLWPSVEAFQRMRDMADAIVRIDPKDTRAREYVQIAPIRAWLAGAKTGAGQIDADVAALAALIPEDRDNADLPYYVALAKIQRARELGQRDPRERAERLVEEAVALMDEAVKARPQGPSIYFRAAEVCSLLAQGEEGHSNATFAARTRASLDRARTLVQPADALFVEIYLAAGKLAMSDYDSGTTEAIYRVLLAGRPDDPEARLALADFLAEGPAGRDEAIRILSRPVPADDGVRGPRVLRVQALQIQVLAALTSVRCTAAEAATGPAERQMLTGQVEEGYAKVAAAAGARPAVLRLQGRVRLLQGKPTEAIRVLTKACELLHSENAPVDGELTCLLAEAYRRSGNRVGASGVLDAALRLAPEDKRVRLSLIGLCSADTPPAWGTVERLLNEAQSMPQLMADPEWYRAEATMWLGRHDAPKAVEKIRQALALAPTDPGLVRDYFGMLLAAGDYAAILRESENFPANDPIRARLLRGQAKQRSGDPAGAAPEFDAALAAADSGNDFATAAAVVITIAKEAGDSEALRRIAERAKAQPRWRLIAVFLLQSKGEDATTMAGSLLADLDKLPPEEQVTALRVAADVYTRARPGPQVFKAQKVLLRLVEQAPQDRMALNNLACLLADEMFPPRPEEALAYSQRAYDLMRQAGTFEPAIVDTYGWVLVLVGRVDEGIVLLKQALDRSPSPVRHYHLAESYLKKSLPVEAQAQLTAARALADQAEKDHQPVARELASRLDAVQARTEELIHQQDNVKAH